MAALKTHRDKKALLLGDFICVKNSLNSRAIHTNGLFHENVKSVVHGMLEMQGTKARGSCYGHEVDAMLHYFLVCVETGEHGTFVDNDLFAILLFQAVNGSLSLVDEGIGNSHQLRVVRRIHDLRGGSRAATTATNQADADGFALGSFALDDGGETNGRGSACGGGSTTKKFSARDVCIDFFHGSKRFRVGSLLLKRSFSGQRQGFGRTIQIAQGPLDTIQKVLEHGGVHPSGLVVAEVGVEDTPLAIVTNPRDGIIIGFGVAFPA